ncbi:MAG: diphthine synthase [Nanohaloarchaea archaeon SW_10_44_10]|nr:MAG: diphthine synthase [Nanohaloarchaea archaeon SW_10_44_10]
MLYLIGLGLDDGEVTQKGLEALEEANRAFAEFYTNTENISLEKLERKTGKEIEKLSREEVERSDKVLESAENQDTAFLVSGDPLTATTHYDIKHRAEEKEIDVEVIHAPSIFASIAETGLNVYKFGRTVTLPNDSAPESVTEYINKNDEIGLHSLILLDINYPANEAAQKLTDMDESLADRETVVIERANHKDQQITVLRLEQAAEHEFGSTPHSIILTGEKSHKEEEFLKSFK